MVLLFLVSILASSSVFSAPVSSHARKNDTVNYLVKYGYLDTIPLISTGKPDYIASNFNDSVVTQALKDFQRFFLLNETGIVDNATETLMKRPRCGVPDKGSKSFKVIFTPSGRRKRDIVIQNRRRKSGPMISKYYFCIKDIDKLFYDHDTVYNAIEYAFNMWASVTNLIFIRGDIKSKSDIILQFLEGDHSDGSPFDGVGKILAHATTGFPWIVHFDTAEPWVLGRVKNYNKYFLRPDLRGNEVDLVQTAMHEIGHLFGLNHTTTIPSVMFPYNTKIGKPGENFYMYEYDVKEIQKTFGTCSPNRFDAIFSAKNRLDATFITVGPYVYKIRYSSGVSTVEQSWPRTCKEEFGVEYIHEAIQHGHDNYLYLFGRNQQYKINMHTTMSVAAGPTESWAGLNKSIQVDAVAVFPDKYTYLFQKDLVYKWIPLSPSKPSFPQGRVDPSYPKKISDVFPGVPDDLDTAYRSPQDGQTYIFKGRFFYVWNDQNKRAEGLYPITQFRDVCDIYQCTRSGCTHW